MLVKSGIQIIHVCVRTKRHKTASETLLRDFVMRRSFLRFLHGLSIFITSRPIRTPNGTKVTSRITIPVYLAPFASVTFVAGPTRLTSASSKQAPCCCRRPVADTTALQGAPRHQQRLLWFLRKNAEWDSSSHRLLLPPTYQPLVRHGDHPSICRSKLQSPKRCFKSTIFFPMMTPLHQHYRPSPCPTQVRHGSACKISPRYVAPFLSLSRADANSTLSYLVDYVVYGRDK